MMWYLLVGCFLHCFLETFVICVLYSYILILHFCIIAISNAARKALILFCFRIKSKHANYFKFLYVRENLPLCFPCYICVRIHVSTLNTLYMYQLTWFLFIAEIIMLLSYVIAMRKYYYAILSDRVCGNMNNVENYRHLLYHKHVLIIQERKYMYFSHFMQLISRSPTGWLSSLIIGLQNMDAIEWCKFTHLQKFKRKSGLIFHFDIIEKPFELHITQVLSLNMRITSQLLCSLSMYYWIQDAMSCKVEMFLLFQLLRPLLMRPTRNEYL